MRPVQVVCDACDSLLGTLVVQNAEATWEPHRPMRPDQRAEYRERYPEGLPSVLLDGSDATPTAPQAYCPNGHTGFDVSKRALGAAVHDRARELRLRPGVTS
jgi:hypothetical protein